MTNKELIKKLAEMNVISIAKEDFQYMLVEDMESYAGYAEIWFDEKGNTIKVKK